jgi:hypothetical protein
MKKTLLFIAVNVVMTVTCCSCRKELIEYKQGDLKISVEKGEHWLHDFPLFLGISKKNPPQIAIWMETLQGKYVATIYVSNKIATQSWQSAGNNRRKEALPHWCHSRGVMYADSLYLPTKKQPVTDGVSGATPKSDFDVRLILSDSLKQFVIKVEVNHSTDFNDAYPQTAVVGDVNYSGGKEGSGQPAVVYAAQVNLESQAKQFEAHLAGHSSPDGSVGDIYTDTSGLTTALSIVKRINITIQE